LVFGAVEEVVDGLIACSPKEEDGDECGSKGGFEEGETIGCDFDYGIQFE
jgi:hypothetical protein